MILLYEEQERSAPKALEGDLKALIDRYREVVRSGDDSMLSGAELGKYLDRIHSFDVSNCKFRKVPVGAVEYAYEGLPDTLKTRSVSFELNNQGAENHELALFRKNEGVEEPIDELLKLPRAKFDEKVISLGSALAAPGAQDHLLARLRPGNYAVVCFQPTAKPDGPPHHTKGMFGEFKVE